MSLMSCRDSAHGSLHSRARRIPMGPRPGLRRTEKMPAANSQFSSSIAADFKDATHLGDPARDRLTDYVTGWLKRKFSNDWEN